MLRRLLFRTHEEPDTAAEPSPGQLDNKGLEAIVLGVIESKGWGDDRTRIVVEVGTGGGRGSTAAINRALTASNCEYQLIGYEGSPELATEAAEYWGSANDVRVVNEYFMNREDIDRVVTPLVTESDRASYLPEFAAVATVDNFLVTVPPGPIDLLFIDSVRYTHLAILRAASPWLTPETIVVMEDDIPDYGELAILEHELELRDVTRHDLEGHLWPLVQFRIAA